MKWEKQTSNNGVHCLNVEADWSELSDDYECIVAEYAKAPVPGFRPGKVPRNIIEKRFQKQIIDNLSYRTSQRISREAFREAGIGYLGHVEAEEVECAKNQDFKAKFNFHPMPKFDLPDISHLSIDDNGLDPRDQISLRLLEQVRFDIPEKLVKDELAIDGIEESDPGSKKWEETSNRIKLMLILKRIARQEGIDIDEADVSKRIAEKVEDFGTTKKTLQKELERGGGMQRLRDILLAESTLEYLIEKNK
jgi:FKBP-type peptidyl-prolyl cis-trans isomerase (trigger factor)